MNLTSITQKPKPFTVIELPDKLGNRVFTRDIPVAFLVQNVGKKGTRGTTLEVLAPRDFIHTPLANSSFIQVECNPGILTETRYAELMKIAFKNKTDGVEWWHATLAYLRARLIEENQSGQYD